MDPSNVASMNTSTNAMNITSVNNTSTSVHSNTTAAGQVPVSSHSYMPYPTTQPPPPMYYGYYPPPQPYMYMMLDQQQPLGAACSDEIIQNAFQLKNEEENDDNSNDPSNKVEALEDEDIAGIDKEKVEKQKKEKISWACRYCTHIITSTDAPTKEYIREHLNTCTGNPLRNNHAPPPPPPHMYYGGYSNPYAPPPFNYGAGGGYPSTPYGYMSHHAGNPYFGSYGAPYSNVEETGCESGPVGVLDDGQASFDGLPGSDSDLLIGNASYTENGSVTQKPSRRSTNKLQGTYSVQQDARNATISKELLNIEIAENDPLLRAEDRMLLTDYFLYMMQQLQVCHFTERDRKTRGGKRENIEVGFAGLQCRHCAGNSCARKFFWSDADRLANSFSEIPSHVLMCRMTPGEVKHALGVLKAKHSEDLQKMPRGSQKKFIRRMWRRLHNKPELSNADKEDEKPSTIVRRKKRTRNSDGSPSKKSKTVAQVASESRTISSVNV